uniref:Uncharacterized protein n=1 Tax=Acrobeloides nanus TaxID=290746 RepID=A0A914CC22_9BILA
MNRDIPINVYGADRSVRRGTAQTGQERTATQSDRQRQWKSDRAQSLEEDLSILRARDYPYESAPRS